MEYIQVSTFKIYLEKVKEAPYTAIVKITTIVNIVN